MTIRVVVVALLAPAVILGGPAGCAPHAHGTIEHAHVAFDISPDGEHVVFSSANADLYLLHLKTLRMVQLTNTKTRETAPAFSPDGRSIAYAADAEGSQGTFIFIRPLDGSQGHQLTRTPGMNDSIPSFSEDGSQIVFARAHRHRPYSMGGWTWDDWDVYVMKRDGTDQRRISHQKYRGVASPRFALNGQSAIYSATMDRARGRLAHTIFEVDARGGRPPKTLLGDPPMGEKYGASRPALSRDGKFIVFLSDRVLPYHYDMFIMNRDGSDPMPLGVTLISSYNLGPVFLPDGKSVLFLAGTEWNEYSRPIFSSWQVDTDGRNPRRIADSGLFTRPLGWKKNP